MPGSAFAFRPRLPVPRNAVTHPERTSAPSGRAARLHRVHRHEHARRGAPPPGPARGRGPCRPFQVGTARRPVPRVQAAVRGHLRSGRVQARRPKILPEGNRTTLWRSRRRPARRGPGRRRGRVRGGRRGRTRGDVGRARRRQDGRAGEQGNARRRRAAGHGTRGEARREVAAGRQRALRDLPGAHRAHRERRDASGTHRQRRAVPRQARGGVGSGHAGAGAQAPDLADGAEDHASTPPR